MKKLLLLSFILFVLFTKVFAQDCKWEENKKDPISDAKYLKSKYSLWVRGEKISANVWPFLKSYIELKDGKVSLSAHFELSTALSLEKIQNPEIIIKLADGNKIDITSDEQFSTNYDASASKTTSDLRWLITNDNIKKLAVGKITAIRISFAGHDYSFILDDKHTNELLTVFSCMSKEL